MALTPAEVVAATAITLAQLAGNEPDTLAALVQAGTTTAVPRETAPLIALCIVDEQLPPPSDMLMTSATLALAGTPLTQPPDAQRMASAISDSEPPHRPSTRTGTTLALNAVPATPAVVVTAATVPATWVPYQLELDVEHPLVEFQSPSSAGLSSRPLPSRAAVASLMKS